MIYRQDAKYPPYCHLVSLLIQSTKEEELHLAANDMKNYLINHLSDAVVLGPAPSMIYKMNDIYRKRILIKFTKSQSIYESLQFINDYYNRKQKGKVSVICDFNPYSQI